MSLIVKAPVPTQITAPAIDKGDMASCIQHVAGLMSKSGVSISDVRPIIIRLFEEGLNSRTIIDALIERHHEKVDAKVLGESSNENLALEDLRIIENRLGINESNGENRQWWEEKFRSGKASYWCPKCGYSGNSEFRSSTALGSDFAICHLCGFFEATPYFTRKWTDEERRTFEAERAAKQAGYEAKRVEKEELQKRANEFVATLRVQAIKAVKAIDEFQWVEMGEDPDAYAFDETLCERMIKQTVQLMARPTARGHLPLPAEAVIEFFKVNLATPTEDTTPAMEFERCATRFNQQLEEGL